MYKLIVSDFDNTLINDEEEIPLSTIVLIDELRRKKIKFAIVTERPISSLLYYNRDFQFVDYLITSSGSYIYDVNKDKIIFKKNISIRDIKKIINNFYDKSIIYLTDNINWNLISKESVYRIDNVKVVDKDEFIEENKTNIYKIDLYFKDKVTAEKSLEEIKLLGLNINANLQIYDDKYFIEITNSLVSKDKGLEVVVKKEKLNMSDVISFGDGYNDIELLKKSGCGIAVENACTELKEIADDITLDNNSKGVEIYIKNILDKNT